MFMYVYASFSVLLFLIVTVVTKGAGVIRADWFSKPIPDVATTEP